MTEVENLTKYYGILAAIEDVSFTVQEGEILGFLGPNAVGKTATMRILTGFMPPSSGKARVAGFDAFEDSLEVRKRIGYMTETMPLYPEMTVSPYLNFVARIREIDDRRERIADIMDTCDIAHYADTLIGKLSKGYRQRVGLAQALVHDLQVLVLDEPTIGLDPKQILEVRQLIKRLGGDHTVILSTHILPEAAEVCGRVVIINEGRVVAEGTPEMLTAELQQREGAWGGRRVGSHFLLCSGRRRASGSERPSQRRGSTRQAMDRRSMAHGRTLRSRSRLYAGGGLTWETLNLAIDSGHR